MRAIVGVLFLINCDKFEFKGKKREKSCCTGNPIQHRERKKD